MNQTRVLIIVLSLALLASNAWWFYQALDAAVTASYREVSFQEHQEALTQALALIPVAARTDSTQTQVISAATGAAIHKQTFEKDGYLWGGRLGLRFGDNGRIAEVTPAWKSSQ